MFGMLLGLSQFCISIVYPLHQSFKSIQGKNPAGLMQWLIYWIVLSALMSLQNFFNPLIRLVPFIGFLKLYLSAWLVFPVLDSAEYKLSDNTQVPGTKFNGSIVIWDFYIIPLMLNFDAKLAGLINTSELKRAAVNLFNLTIDTWFQGNPKLKFFGSYASRDVDEESAKSESFMGSVYVIFKESHLLGSHSQAEAAPMEASIHQLPEHRNWTLLKSIVSMVPYFNGHVTASSDSENATSARSVTTGTTPANGRTTSRAVSDSNSISEEFDVVDAADIREANDSDGSETSTGWFKWRNSGAKAAPSTDVPVASADEGKKQL